jgi:outer membrane protein assembly factor BamD
MKKKIYSFVFFVFCLTSCSSTKNLIPMKEEMYDGAKNNLLKGEFLVAAQKFEMIKELYPFTEESNKAVVMSSYSYYKEKNFEESLQLIEYFKKINFNNSDVEYIFFLEILNNLGKIQQSSKDVVLVKNTINLIDNFKKIFSINSIYNDYLQNQKEYLINIYIKRKLEIVDFYIFNNNLIGALNHLIGIEERFYNERYTNEIHYKFFELYRHINFKDGAEYYFKLLENNKDSRWYKYAIKI